MVMAARSSELDEEHRSWGAGRIAGAVFVPDPNPLVSPRRDRRESLQEQETELQRRQKQPGSPVGGEDLPEDVRVHMGYPTLVAKRGVTSAESTMHRPRR
jgi:hypothetical protein